MPVEYTLLRGQPEPLTRCPKCGEEPFRSDPWARGTVQSGWRRLLGLPYCCVICDSCQEVVGYEMPPAKPSPPEEPLSKESLTVPEQQNITVPVTVGFDGTKVGFLTIEKEALPPTPEFCFSIGALVDTIDLPGSVPTKPYVGKYELKEVALVSDASYAGYLKQIGVIEVAPGWKRYTLIESGEGSWCISTPEDADDMAKGLEHAKLTEIWLPEFLVKALPEHQGW